MSNSVACITTDGWTNVKSDLIVNYMATSPECSLFLESVFTGQQGHNAAWIAQEIERVFQTYSLKLFACAVTDNTSANKNAWEILKKKFPSSYFQGCCSHGLRLLVKDIFSATKTRKAGEINSTYPVG
jgi:hypothetical protein